MPNMFKRKRRRFLRTLSSRVSSTYGFLRLYLSYPRTTLRWDKLRAILPTTFSTVGLTARPIYDRIRFLDKTTYIATAARVVGTALATARRQHGALSSDPGWA